MRCICYQLCTSIRTSRSCEMICELMAGPGSTTFVKHMYAEKVSLQIFAKIILRLMLFFHLSFWHAFCGLNWDMWWSTFSQIVNALNSPFQGQTVRISLMCNCSITHDPRSIFCYLQDVRLSQFSQITSDHDLKFQDKCFNFSIFVLLFHIIAELRCLVFYMHLYVNEGR